MRATERLTRNLLVLAPARGPAGWRTPLLALALVAALAVASHVHREALPWLDGASPAASPADKGAPVATDLRPLQQQLEQAEMALQVARAQSRELERQIDVLNLRLRETQEELAFFRKARDTKRPETR